jgi:hypothetical protein
MIGMFRIRGRSGLRDGLGENIGRTALIMRFRDIIQAKI